MYEVRGQLLKQRLAYIDQLLAVCEQLQANFHVSPWHVVDQFASERLMHLAIETVTDISSVLIDAFELREASSYEDMIEILHTELAIDTSLRDMLITLVKLRKKLVQEYMSDMESTIRPLLVLLPPHLVAFREHVERFIEKENQRWGYPRLG